MICRRPDRNRQVGGGRIDDVKDQLSVRVLIDELFCHIGINIAGIYGSILDRLQCLDSRIKGDDLNIFCDIGIHAVIHLIIGNGNRLDFSGEVFFCHAGHGQLNIRVCENTAVFV